MLRSIYTRFFVADGNFKADHVRNHRAAEDIWFSDGGGMMANRLEYQEFLKEAKNKPTVSTADFTSGRPTGRAYRPGVDS